MSTKLKPLDLTSFAVGSSGTIDFNAFVKFNPMHLQDKAHIWLYNESGAGVDVVMVRSNNSHYLPAGAWGTFDLEPNDSQVNVTVTYLLPNAPVSLLNAIYYAPGEAVPQAFTLGNSPIGITGGVSTSSVQTLSNETAVLGTKIIDIGTLTIGDLLDIFNDHFVWKVQQAGVAHQVLAGNTAGNPLQLGQAGDIAEVLGKLTVDQLLTAALGMAISASGLSVVGGTVTDTLQVTGITEVDDKITGGAANDVKLDAATGKTVFLKVNGVNILGINSTGAILQGAFNLDIGASGVFRFRNGTTIQNWSSFSGTGTGTYNHNFGSAPFDVVPIVSVSGSATQGFDTITSTQVHITLGAVLAFKAFCWS